MDRWEGPAYQSPLVLYMQTVRGGAISFDLSPRGVKIKNISSILKEFAI